VIEVDRAVDVNGVAWSATESRSAPSWPGAGVTLRLDGHHRQDCDAGGNPLAGRPGLDHHSPAVCEIDGDDRGRMPGAEQHAH
jgi:hypothetical protein